MAGEVEIGKVSLGSFEGPHPVNPRSASADSPMASRGGKRLGGTSEGSIRWRLSDMLSELVVNGPKIGFSRPGGRSFIGS